MTDNVPLVGAKKFAPPVEVGGLLYAPVAVVLIPDNLIEALCDKVAERVVARMEERSAEAQA